MKFVCMRAHAECTWICTNSCVTSLAGRPGQARASSRAVEAVQDRQSIASCMHRAGLSGAAARLLIWVMAIMSSECSYAKGLEEGLECPKWGYATTPAVTHESAGTLG